MKFNVGDKVKFLNDVGGGEVTKVIDKYTVMVHTDDGFEFPHTTNDLIKVEIETPDSFFSATPEPAEQPKTVEQQLTSDEPQLLKDNEEVNIYLAFVPENQSSPTNSSQNLQLINDSNWHLMYVYQIRKKNSFESYPGVLQPNYIEHLRTYELSEINDIKEIVIQIIFFRKTPYDIKDPMIKMLNFKPEHFYKQGLFTKNDFFEDKALIYPVLEENPLAEAMNKFKSSDVKKVVIEKEIKSKNINKPKEFKKPKKTDIVEIDLHLVELLDDAKGMSPKEMLDFQMEKFKEELEKSQKTHHIKKAVFIHGKGNGSLKTKIRAHLDINKINYQDASFQKYGFGATLVFV